MRQLRKLTKREWKEIGEKYKNGGVYNYRGKLTYFYKGGEFWEAMRLSPTIYNSEKWEIMIVLPGVEIIPKSTFEDFKYMKTVIMSDTVKRIEEMAFNGCISLGFVRLSKQLKYIGPRAFFKCESLTSIFIPESCRQIDDFVFAYCSRLIILKIPRTTKLGKGVVEKTTLIFNSTFDSNGFFYGDDKNEEVNDWIKYRHNKFPLHKLCCSEEPKFTTVPTKQECLRQDDLRFTPLMYLMANHTAEYESIKHMIKIGGKKLLFIKDKKGMNSLHRAYDLGDEAMIRLLVKKGGRQLVDTLESKRIDASSSIIKSALLLHDYIYAVENTNRKDNLDEMDEMVDKLLESKLSFREVTEIFGIKDIPDKHRQKFQEYNQSLLDQELKSFSENQEKVPLMRSTITVVGRGRDGKTSTINSLKGLPFQPYCESTKGTDVSEVDVHEIGIDVSCVDATGVTFEAAERDAYSTKRAVEKQLVNTGRDLDFNKLHAFPVLEPVEEMDKVRMAVDSDISSTKNITESKIRSISSRLVNKLRCLVCAKNKEKAKKKDEDLDKVRMAADDVTSPAKNITESEIRSISSKLVDLDIAEKKADIKLGNIEAESIRFTIYDNGGQRIFRSIQHLFLSREGIFIVVFDVMKVMDEKSRIEALEHLRYWLLSIKMDACIENSTHETVASTKYPPIILVGTHYDEFLKLNGDPTEGLKALNKILVDNLHLSDLVPLPCRSNDFVTRDMQQLYNEAQDLCFWPVDNSNPNDANIQAMRRILLEAAINDPGFDIAQEVPISFLRAMDKLTAISEEVPILPIINRNDPQDSNPNDAIIQAIRQRFLDAVDIAEHDSISYFLAMDNPTTMSEEIPVPSIDSNDPKTYSVINVMIECGVFDNGIGEEQHALDFCKAIMKQYQNIGHFIYFDQVGLEDYCILDPQWLINMITYIVRDFKLHRFLRDFNAMSLNNGESWKSLLNNGILDGALLRKLWLDREHEQFLTKLMLELGIFGNLFGDVEALSNTKYTVPIAVTISSNESRELSLPALIDHLGVKSLDDTMKECINMSSCPFNLVPFYSRLVNRLISEWHRGYNIEKNLPELLPCAANLCLGEDYKFSILINEEDSTLDIFVSDHNKMNIILKYISEACSFVNAKVYQSRLELFLPAVNIGDEVILRNATNATAITTEVEIQEINECHPNLQALIDVLKNEKLAHKIHENAEDLTPEELIQAYHSDEDAFVKDILPELGITQKMEQFRLIKILKKKPKPLEDELYAIFNFLDENDLAVKSEEEAIRKSIRMSSYFSIAYKVLRDDKRYDKLHKELAAHRECKVVHFGMHGRSIDTFVTTTLASRLKESSVKCMVLNMCKSEPMANDLRDKAKIENLVYWSSAVEDNAARTFSEAFYYYLCVKGKENYLEFQAAFDFAIESLRLRGYLLIDPANKDELEEKTKDIGKPDLEAAGIPHFHDNSQEQRVLAAASLPNSTGSSFYASRNINSLTTTQQGIDNSMDVDSTNASEQVPVLPHDSSQEQHAGQRFAAATSSFTSTAMAPRQLRNQNSKKRKIDGQRKSDDADIANGQESQIPNQNLGDQNQRMDWKSTNASGQEQDQSHPDFLNNSSQEQQADQISVAVDVMDAGSTTGATCQSVVDKPKACQLKCIYKFACGHEIEANCQFIIYNNSTRPSLTDIKDIYYRTTPARSEFKCTTCKKNFCKSSNGKGLKKIPIPIENTDGNEFHDCFFAHNCNGNDVKPIINVGQICREFSLTSKDNKSGNSRYSYCNKDGCKKEKRCIEEDKARKEAENLDSLLGIPIGNIFERENECN